VSGLEQCPGCHPERSEGSLRPSSQTLRCAQGDRHSLQISAQKSIIWLLPPIITLVTGVRRGIAIGV